MWLVEVEGGKVNFDYYGVAENECGWWKVEGGKVNFDYYGIAENEYGWWKIEGGKVNFDYTGLADSDNGRMYVSMVVWILVIQMLFRMEMSGYM